MGKRSLVLVLAVAALTARAISQEIVIEPTNGNAQGKVRVSRPAASEAIQPKSTAKPPAAERAATKNSAKVPAKKAALKQVSAKPKAAPVEARPAVPAAEQPKIEAPVAPVKKIPARPQWALTDNRDANTLQIEIANALARDPKLTGSSIQVKVDEGAVTLEGQAMGTEEHLQAVRLAQSYAWNRKLLDKIDVVRSVSAKK